MKYTELALFYIVRYSAVLLPLITAWGISQGSYLNFIGFSIVFGFYFIVEVVLHYFATGAFSHKSNEFEHVDPNNKNFLDQFNIHIYSCLQLILIPYAIYSLSQLEYGMAWGGGILSVAATVGSVGGLAGHEFIHRKTKFEKNLGILVYASVNYGHFNSSHIRGHHKSVGLAHDWSTSKRYESYYAFLYRALVHGYIGGWRLENEAMKKRGKKLFSKHNFMVKITILQILILTSVFLFTGIRGLISYLLFSFIAVSLMEMVNYLSHYGLVREKLANGRYEPVTNRHSWESNSKVTNWFIFNAGKHCHHHTKPNDSHDDLKLCHEKDFLPYGLPLMSLIALLPPVYFPMMDQMFEEKV